MAFGDIKGTKTGSATSITASFAISTGTSFAVVVGDLIVSLLAEQSARTVTACADDLGNTYTPIGPGADAGTVTGRGFYTRVTNAGTLTTVTFTATASANNCVGLAVGFEGPFAVSPLDAAPTAIINDNTTPYTCPATGTLAQAVELIVCAIVHNSNPTLTATAPNIKAVELNTATVLKAALGHQTVSSTASVAPAWTSSGTPTTSGYATASFKRETTPGAGSAPGVGTASAVGAAITGALDAWNTYDKSANITLSNSDKTATLSSSVDAGIRSTQTRANETAGKFYWEVSLDNVDNPTNVRVGVSSVAQSRTATTDAFYCDVFNGFTYVGASITSAALTSGCETGDVVCFAWDTGAQRFWVRKNNDIWNFSETADPAAGVGGSSITPTMPAVNYALWAYATTTGRSFTVRTETAEFTYNGPSGFTSWMGEALGPATINGVGTAAGVGAAVAVSGAIKETAGAAAGVATAFGASPVATTDAVGAAAGVGAATAVGVAFTGIPDAWSAADKSANIALSNNDKTATLGAAVTSGVRSTTKYLNGTETQKFYVEFLLNNVVGTVSNQVGLREASASLTSTAGSTFQCASNSTNILTGNATVIGNVGGVAMVDGDIICMAWAPALERGWFRKNSGLWNNDAAANPATNTNGLDISVLNNTNHALLFLIASTGSAASTTVRTEAADLTLTAPSGFVSWMGEALGAATSDTVGTAAGVGAATATGAVGSAAVEASGSANGIGTATAQGVQTASAAGAATGIGAATALSSGAAIASAAGTAAGIGAATAGGAKLGTATAQASGIGSAAATGFSHSAAAVGSAIGIGSAAGIASGASIASSIGAAPGIASAAATGWQVAAVAPTVSGIGAATATGNKIATVAGAAAGIGTAAATGFATSAAAFGTAAGLGAAAATGQKIATATGGAVVGTGAAAASSGATNAAAGAASGIGSATATGFEAAVVITSVVGTANGVGSTSGIGFAIQPSETPGDRVTELPFAPRGGSVPASMRGAAVAASRRTAAVAAHDRIAIVPRRDRAA